MPTAIVFAGDCYIPSFPSWDLSAAADALQYLEGVGCYVSW